VPLGDDVTWSFDVDDGVLAAEGSYAAAIVAEDARGKRSEPVEVELVLDATPPAIASKYPDNAAAQVGFTDGAFSVAVNEGIDLDPAALPATLVTVKNGLNDVPGFAVSFVPETNAVRVGAPATGWPASSTLTVKLDNTALVDLAGNIDARAADFVLQM